MEYIRIEREDGELVEKTFPVEIGVHRIMNDKIRDVYNDKYGIEIMDYRHDESELVVITDIDIDLVTKLNFDTENQFFGYDDSPENTFSYIVGVDSKRPFGSKTVVTDMLNIINCTKTLEELNDDDYYTLYQLMMKMSRVLEICFEHRFFDTGIYFKKKIMFGTWDKLK